MMDWTLLDILEKKAKMGRLFIRYADLGYGDDRCVRVKNIEGDKDGNICLSTDHCLCSPYGEVRDDQPTVIGVDTILPVGDE